MTAEIGYLAKERFSGQVTYWIEENEMRRSMEIIWTDEAPKNEIDNHLRAEQFAPRMSDWVSCGRGKLSIFFRRGYITSAKLI